MRELEEASNEGHRSSDGEVTEPTEDAIPEAEPTSMHNNPNQDANSQAKLGATSGRKQTEREDNLAGAEKKSDNKITYEIRKKPTNSIVLENFNSHEAVNGNKDDKAPFDMVKSEATYLEWLELESRLFPVRYYREQHTKAQQKYNIVRVLGQGGFGLVLLVNVEKGGPLYAMKVMSKEKIKEKKMIKYIIGERRALSAVHHPLIMSLIDKLKDNSNVYIIMPFIECGDLFRLMLSTRLKRFSYEEAKFYVAQVLLAFEYLHKMRVVYRDLKPENLMLDRSGYVQLADLGFAKLLDANRERTYSTLGTPDYMAPEIFSAKNCGYSFSVDWWTTGCLLYEFMVGFPPFHTPDGNTMNVIKKIMTSEVQFPNFIKPDAKDLVSCLCQKNPHKRLGCQKTGAAAIREHPFFQDIDFVRVFHRQLPAPHKPTSKDDKTFYTGRPVPKNVIKISRTMRFNTMFKEF
ncbi:hypothetical protein BOX15_Mlig010466g1 [Macrostomum lignano]|uniref:Uncharacterized protein n=2 Tax=Macrostomum lignano TaxID=282301 RepID=A0A267DAW5_9PLAT|nr:hypothetical protein BOX15_Mlig010466g4 [Macrostomum lignano]PAA62451.1 hypothetical protein BOX15_Mlig010466g1 [Macrostomum lignano]